MSLHCCRLCLENSVNVVDVFDRYCKEMELQLKIHQVLSLLITPRDPLKSICPKCIDHVTSFYRYWTHVKLCQVKLTQAKDSELTQGKMTNNEDYSEMQIEYIKMEDDLNASDNNNFDGLVNQVEKSEDQILDVKKDENVEDKEVNIEYVPCDPCHSVSRKNFELLHKMETLASGKPSRVPHHKKKSRKENNTLDGQKYVKDERMCDTIYPSFIDPTEFPTEIVRDGKMIIRKKQLDDLLKKFYNLHCPLCPDLQKFEKVPKLLDHIKKVHKTRGYVKCYCNTLLYDHRTTYFHMAKHLQPSAFECPICKRSLPRLNNLKIHMQTHLPKNEKIHKCDECNEGFSYAYSLKNHKIMHHVQDEERILHKCNVCKKEYKTELSLYNHVRSQHTDTPKVLCTECGKTLPNMSAMRSHMLINHDKTGRHRVQCKHCGLV